MMDLINVLMEAIRTFLLGVFAKKEEVESGLRQQIADLERKIALQGQQIAALEVVINGLTDARKGEVEPQPEETPAVPAEEDELPPWEEAPAPAEPEVPEEAQPDDIDDIDTDIDLDSFVWEEEVGYKDLYKSYADFAAENGGKVCSEISWDMTPADFAATVYARQLTLCIYRDAMLSGDPKGHFNASAAAAYKAIGSADLQTAIRDMWIASKNRDLPPVSFLPRLLNKGYWVSDFMGEDCEVISQPKKEAPAATPVAAPAEAPKPKKETMQVKPAVEDPKKGFNGYVKANTIKGNTWCSAKVDIILDDDTVAKCYSIQHAICVLEAQHSAGSAFAAMMADPRGFSSYMGKGPWDGQACSKCITKMHKEHKSGAEWSSREAVFTRAATIAAYLDPRNEVMLSLLKGTKGKAIMASRRLPNGKEEVYSTEYTRLLQELRDTILE